MDEFEDIIGPRPLWVAEPMIPRKWKVAFWSVIFGKDTPKRRLCDDEDIRSANLVSSKLPGGKHMPVLDLDYSHAVVASTREGHHHLYLNRPISKWRWWCLMTGLWLGRVIEPGFFRWSLRRGQSFVRTPWTKKSPAELVYPPREGLELWWDKLIHSYRYKSD